MPLGAQIRSQVNFGVDLICFCGDGVLMVTRGNTSAHRLSDAQKQELVLFVIERWGSDLDYARFKEVVLTVFEDIPGFETIASSLASFYVDKLWRVYHRG